MASQQEQPEASTSGRTAEEEKPVTPIVMLVIGMAGSGKTTLLQRFTNYFHSEDIPSYILNLDPAVLEVPYESNIDIRDTVNYKNVMKQYSLGPNGGILTAMNLFATRFDQVIDLCQKPRDPRPRFVVVDTPGQIEIFTWSASGAIITEAFACTFPTMVLYVLDTPRCQQPQAFMSNMLQACSILYKTRLPMLLAFNKTDVCDHSFALEWMSSFEAFQDAIEGESTYASSLSKSLSLVLEEFYANLRTVGVSAVTGEGMAELFEQAEACRQEYERDYLPDVEKKRKERADLDIARQAAELEKIKLDHPQQT